LLLFIEELKLCKKLKQFELYAFSVIYDHVNLLFQPSKKYNISKVMKSLKENVSRDINYVIFNEYRGGDTSTCRLPIRRIIDDCRLGYIQKHKQAQALPKFQWQKSFYDHIIRNEQDFQNHYYYTKHNPFKHGLPILIKYQQ